MKRKLFLLLLFLPTLLHAQNNPLPTKAQVEWQKQETYAFIHFGQNTFNDLEWGYGDADPKNFNPANLDVEQWVRILKEAGMKSVIITAKHHDGFCLWPSKYTDYTIAASPYKMGKGDIVKEVADACRKYGLNFGVYLSPWDRHQASYGTEEYVDYYMKQMTELLTNYGPVTEVWLDGANGGDGYYGGAREMRQIDRRTYYKYPKIFELIHFLQPDAVIFSDGGPDCRWVGNEAGVAGETNWSFLRIGDVYPGYPNSAELTVGHKDGDKWVPAECDVSIRPGWFYHEREDSQVRTPEQLIDLYLKNVGRNSTFLLNVPPNKDGRISPVDSLSLIGFKTLKDKMFADNLFDGQKAEASSAVSKKDNAQNVLDKDYDTFWAAKASDKTPTLTLTCKKPTKINMLVIQEYIPFGQSVAKFAAEYQTSGGTWLALPVLEQTTTIGYKRILKFDAVTAKKFRLRIIDSRRQVYINNVEAYLN